MTLLTCILVSCLTSSLTVLACFKLAVRADGKIKHMLEPGWDE